MRISAAPTLVTLAVVIIAAETPAWAQAAPPGRPAPSALSQPAVSDDWQVLHERWAKVMRDLRVPGMAVAVVKDDAVILLDALGNRDAEGKLPVTVRSPFYIASSTKSFTALAVAILVDEGKVEFDAPVRRYLPRFALKDPQATSDLTIRDLLAHRRGIDSGLISTGEAYTGLMPEDRYYRLLARVKPANKFQYSNLNFTLAGRVIKAVSGSSWQEFLAERVFAPAGMTNSYCLASRLYADPAAAMPIEEVNGEWQLAPIRKTDATMHAAGGLGASAADLAQWLRLNMAGGVVGEKRIVSEKMLREMHSPQVTVERGAEGFGDFTATAYGLGWFLGEMAGRPLVHHFGGYEGARCHISFLPGERTGVAVVVNESGPASAFAEMVALDCYAKALNTALPDILPRMSENAAKVRARRAARNVATGDPPSDEKGLSRPASAYAGEYSHEDFGTAIVTSENGRLAAHLGALRGRMISTGVDEFVGTFLHSDDGQGLFEIDEQGNVRAVVFRGNFTETRFEKQ